MSPRNLDGTECTDSLFSGDSQDPQTIDFTPNILHKKHKVIKLIKAQLLNIQEQGLLNCINSGTAENDTTLDERYAYLEPQQKMLRAEESEPELQESSSKTSYAWLIFLLMVVFLLLWAAVWLSTGPLSNRAPHTPIPWSSLVKTDGACELERKYLLRWCTPNYLE